jgi:adenosylhomocysteine nucleosidase
MFLKDGKYYFMWSEGGWTGPDYAVAYAVASSPFGPFERVGKILQQDPSVATGAGHHSVLHVPGSSKWYIAYHRRPLGETDANHRVVCIDLLRFDDKGLILPVAITKDGVPPDALPASASQVVVVVSADAEWRAVRSVLPAEPVTSSPYGEFFTHAVDTAAGRQQVVVFHGGWGKIAAAGSAQYVIDRWRPELLINLGTCGGFRGAIEKGEILLVERTVVYDIVEQMGDAAEAIAAYTSEIDLGWVGSELPPGVRRGLLVSADRDLLPADIPRLRKAYGAVAGDWESGAIAWVAQRNQIKALILRGVSDLVDSRGGEAYGSPNAFEVGARAVMKRLLQDLPLWLDRFGRR